MMRFYFFAVPVVLAVAAGALAFTDRSGWGWFLFGAIVTSSVSFESEQKG